MSKTSGSWKKVGCPEELFLEESDFKDMRVKKIPDLTPHALYCPKKTNYGKPEGIY